MFDPFLTEKQILRKLGGDKKTGKVLVETQLTEGVAQIPNRINLVEGQEYSVRLFDRGASVDLGKFVAAKKTDESASMIYIGNPGLAEGDTEGGVFLAADLYTEGEGFQFAMIVVASRADLTVTIEQTETIVPIDQKYLPGAVVDFDQLGLTAPVLQLLNSGGGRAEVMKDNNYGIDIEEVRQAFPKGIPFVASLDVPGMGFMTVTPVYTLFTSNGFTAAHFDSYMQNDAGLVKFYVRITTNYQAGTIAQVNIAVGFY